MGSPRGKSRHKVGRAEVWGQTERQGRGLGPPRGKGGQKVRAGVWGHQEVRVDRKSGQGFGATKGVRVDRKSGQGFGATKG